MYFANILCCHNDWPYFFYLLFALKNEIVYLYWLVGILIVLLSHFVFMNKLINQNFDPGHRFVNNENNLSYISYADLIT
jgi:hypothetical protein